jgi:hypothetical protein
MTSIACDQNYQDIILRSVLKELKNGLYVDVGARSPDIDF